jgi:hypothetical protein
MSVRIITTLFVILACLALFQEKAFSANPDPTEADTKEYEQDLARIKAIWKSLTPGPTNDLDKYEKFADEIQNKWSKRNIKYYALLMYEICKYLPHGQFTKLDRQYDLVKKYALLVLEKQNEIPAILELRFAEELGGWVNRHSITDNPDFPQMRKKDIEIHIHVWRRLAETIDNEKLIPKPRDPEDVAFELGFKFPSVPLESVEDPVKRAKYKEAIEEFRKNNRPYGEQQMMLKALRSTLDELPELLKMHIINVYSKPPQNLTELKQLLDKSLFDEKTKTEILEALTDEKKKDKIFTDYLKKRGIYE